MEKANMAQKLLKSTNAIKDSNKVEKLYANYLKAKEKNNTKQLAKLSAEIIALLPDALDEIDRLIGIYSKARAELNSQDTLINVDSEGMLKDFNEIKQKLEVIKSRVMPSQNNATQ